MKCREKEGSQAPQRELYSKERTMGEPWRWNEERKRRDGGREELPEDLFILPPSHTPPPRVARRERSGYPEVAPEHVAANAGITGEPG